MKLHFIPWISLLAERLQKFPDVVLDQQRASQNSHDFDDGTSQVEVVLNDSDEAIGDDGNMYLYAYCILSLSPELLDFEMLLQPFVKKFNLLSVFIQVGNLESCQMSCIRQESKVSILL